MKSITRQQPAAQVCWQSYFGEKKFKVLGKTCLEHRRDGGDRVNRIIWKSWSIYEVVRLQPGSLPR